MAYALSSLPVSHCATRYSLHEHPSAHAVLKYIVPETSSQWLTDASQPVRDVSSCDVSCTVFKYAFVVRVHQICGQRNEPAAHQGGPAWLNIRREHVMMLRIECDCLTTQEDPLLCRTRPCQHATILV